MDRDILKEELKSKLTYYVKIITQPDLKAGHNKYKCPLCGSGSHSSTDSDGAFSITKDGKSWKCFSCGKGGDIFTLIKEYEEIEDFPAQMERAINICGTTFNKYYTQKRQKKDIAIKHEKVPIIKGRYKEYLEACHAAAKETDYFRSRGFSDDVVCRFKLGYDEAKNTIVIPYDRDGRYYITRSIEGKSFYKPPGREAGKEPIYNGEALYKQDKPCFICESPLDAISIIVAGNGLCSAVALGGTGHRKLIETVKAERPACTLVLSFDADEAGHEVTGKVAEELSALNVPFTMAEYTWEAYPESGRKDANDCYKNNPEQLGKDIAVIAEGIEQEKEAKKLRRLEEHDKDTALRKLRDFTDGIKGDALTVFIPTGFEKLDKELDGGLYPGLYILGAVSSLGKTSFLLQIADQIAEAGHDVLYFSLEMAATELISKSISRNTYRFCNGVESNAKTARGVTTAGRYKNYSQAEKDLINEAIAAYRAYAGRLYLYDGMGSIGVEQIREKVAEHAELTGNTPLVLIDYLQILAPYDMRAGDKQNTDKAVLELKRLSRDYKATVVGISSFNRDNYASEVNMTAFKESGAIEYGSDVLLALQPQGMKPGYSRQEQKYNIDLVKKCKAGKKRTVEAVILKNRNGTTGGKVGFIYLSLFNCFKTDNDFETEDDWQDVPDDICLY